MSSSRPWRSSLRLSWVWLRIAGARVEAIRPKPARELKFQASKSAAKPDLVILEAGFDRTNPSKWIVKVANSGVADAGATLVNLNFRERRGDERSVPMRVPPLKAGAQATLAYQSDVRRPFLLYLTAHIDFADLVQESNEENNNYTLADRQQGIAGELIDPTEAVPVLGTNIGGTFNEISKEIEEVDKPKKKER